MMAGDAWGRPSEHVRMSESFDGTWAVCAASSLHLPYDINRWDDGAWHFWPLRLQLLKPTGDDRGNAQGDSGRLSLRLEKHGNLGVSHLAGTWRFHRLLMLLRETIGETIDGSQLNSVCCLACRSTAFGCFWYFWYDTLAHVGSLFLALPLPFCSLNRHSWIGWVQSSCCKVCIGTWGWKMRKLAHKQHPQATISNLTTIMSSVTVTRHGDEGTRKRNPFS